MKFNRYFKDNKWAPYAIAGCAVVLFYLFASHVNYLFIGIGLFLGYISPVITGLIMAYILNPLVKLIENKLLTGMENRPVARRIIAVWIMITGVLVLLTVLLVMLIPQLVKSVATFFSNFDSYANSLQALLNSFTSQAEDGLLSFDLSSITRVIDNMIDKLSDYIQDNMGNIVNKSINLGMTIVNTVISFILAIYILCDKDRLKKGWQRFLKAVLTDKGFSDAAIFWKRCNEILIRYMAGDILDGVIVGLINALFMKIAGMDYVVLISVIVGLTNLAPTFGPMVGILLGAFILVFVNPWHALWFIIFSIIVQTLDGYVIKPKLFGNTLGISSLWVLISIIVLGRMFGVAGILLAIPFAAIFDILYKEVFLYHLEKRKADKKAAAAEAEARQAADHAAMMAAQEAIKAVVKKDSMTPGSEKERGKLSEDPGEGEAKT